MAGFRGVVALVKGPNIPVKQRVDERQFLVFELAVIEQTVELSDVGFQVSISISPFAVECSRY